VRGHILIRTVWLGLFLLIGLGTLASFKLAFNASQPVAEIDAVAFVAANADISTVGNSAVSDTMQKGDRLQITHLQPALDSKPVAVEDAPLPPARTVTGAPRIISRHWHDPSDQKREQAAATKSMLKDSKKNVPTVGRRPAVEASSCKPEGLDTLHRAFNMPTSCATSN
jgi:hypothetical protein